MSESSTCASWCSDVCTGISRCWVTGDLTHLVEVSSALWKVEALVALPARTRTVCVRGWGWDDRSRSGLDLKRYDRVILRWWDGISVIHDTGSRNSGLVVQNERHDDHGTVQSLCLKASTPSVSCNEPELHSGSVAVFCGSAVKILSYGDRPNNSVTKHLVLKDSVVLEQSCDVSAGSCSQSLDHGLNDLVHDRVSMIQSLGLVPFRQHWVARKVASISKLVPVPDLDPAVNLHLLELYGCHKTKFSTEHLGSVGDEDNGTTFKRTEDAGGIGKTYSPESHVLSKNSLNDVEGVAVPSESTFNESNHFGVKKFHDSNGVFL